MRNLVILRGAMGAGKSTWLKEKGLEHMVLCPDLIRLMYSTPQMQLNKEQYGINPDNDYVVWALLFEVLEARMKKGEFTIIDATHSKVSDLSKYKDLCDKYRYRRYCVDFTDIPIEVCKERNAKRLPEWKRVPEHAIDKCYARFATQPLPNSWVYIDHKGNDFENVFENRAVDFGDYGKIHIFGDIHGCYEPLKKYIYDVCKKENKELLSDKELLNDDELYLFTGDYIDRGIQNKEVMELLCELCNYNNTLFLPGNHEEWLRMYSFGDIMSIKSEIFLKKTMYEIREVDSKKISNFVRKLGQMAYFKYYDKEYLVTHGGLAFMPKNLQYLSTMQMIKGVGKYSENIDEIYDSNMKDTNIIQCHGHRNIFGIEDYEYEKSYNLEGRVEYGGCLKVLCLEPNNKTTMHNIQNDVYSLEDTSENLGKELKTNEDYIKYLRDHKDIKEQPVERGISSFKYSKKVFYDRTWDDVNIKARGLFVDTDSNKVVARSYDKFFNVNEMKQSQLTHIKSIMEATKLSAVLYKKYNGYLGILSWYNNDIQFHSKSSKNNDFSNWFKEIFYMQNNDQIEAIKAFLRDNNVSLVYEVIDPINDPHIIKNSEKEIILLDIIDNSFEYIKKDYDNLIFLANNTFHGVKVKEKIAEFTGFRELMSYWLEHTNENNMEDIDSEGVVIEIGSNYMTKIKFNYYNFWKHMRKIVDDVRFNRRIHYGAITTDLGNKFLGWLKSQQKEDITADIITLREKFFESLK